MNIAVVDDLADDLLAAKTFLTNYLEKNFAEVVANIQIKTFSDPEDFLSDFKPEKFDLVILDIFMKPLNGIQVAQIVRNQDKDVSIIFLTTSDDFILEGYKVFAVGYFLKPLSENLDQFAKTFQYIFPKLVENQKKLSVRVGSGEILVPYKNILYMKNQSPYRSQKDMDLIKQYPPIDPEQVCDEIHSIARRHEHQETMMVWAPIITLYNYDKSVFHKEDFREVVYLDFEGFKWPCPIGWDRILKTIYGDYMQFPPVEKRGTWHNSSEFNPDMAYTDYMRSLGITPNVDKNK